MFSFDGGNIKVKQQSEKEKKKEKKRGKEHSSKVST